MKHLKWAALPLILVFTIAAVDPGLKIWQYPNRPVPADTAFFVLSEGGVTYNVSAFQLRSKMTQGLATVTYVNSVTNGLGGVSSNYVVEAVTSRVFVAAGGTNVGIVTNYGSGTVTYTVYATNDGGGGGSVAIATNAISAVWSNNVNVATPATNLNFWFSSVAGIGLTNVNGRVDMRFDTLSGANVTNLLNTTSNALWTLTTTAGTNFTLAVSNTLYTNLVAQLNAASNFLSTNFTSQLNTSSNFLWTNITTIASNSVTTSGTNFNSIRVTNQILYIPGTYSGSNGTANTLTNQLDLTQNTFRRMTNMLDNNHVFVLSNITVGVSFVHHFAYGSVSAKTVSYRLPGGATTGTNILWYSPTNGSYDFTVNPSAAYTVAGFVDAQTNVVMNMNSTEFIPLNFVQTVSLVASNIAGTNFTTTSLSAINGGISNLFATNLVATTAQVTNFVVYTNFNSLFQAQMANVGISNVTATNISVKAGGSATLAQVGGTVSVQTTPVATAGAAETNLISYTVPAHMLTNNNDRLIVRASGRFAATSNGKNVKLVFGSEEIFASGSQVANTGAWALEAEIIRTGNTSQSVNASFNGGTNTSFLTESSLDLAQTNGINTVLKITGTAAGDGDITNRTLTVEWMRAP